MGQGWRRCAGFVGCFMLYLSSVVDVEAQTVDAMSEAQAVFVEGLSVVEDGGDGFDIAELWGPVSLWSWAQVHAWGASILRRSGEVSDVLDWAGEALDAGCEFAGLLAERLQATERRKRLLRASEAAEPAKAERLRRLAEAVEVPAVPVEDETRGDWSDTGAARWKREVIKAKERGDKRAAEAARGWVRWYRNRDSGTKGGREREALARVPLVTLPAVAVTLADCVDIAHNRVAEGVDWQQVKGWPSDWEADGGAEVDWHEVREAALERDAPGAKWVNADPAEVARAVVASVLKLNGYNVSGCWDWWSQFKGWGRDGQLDAVWRLSRQAVDARLTLKRDGGRLVPGGWVRNDATEAVYLAAARLIGRELFRVLSDA
jgi:hypothetical protein